MAQALELQRRFVADASHELRTPLTLLSTRAQLVRRRLPTIEPEDARTTLASGIDEIVQDAQALTDILEDLLIAADPREADAPTAIDLAVCADEAVAALTPQADARSLTLGRTGIDGGAMVLGSTASFRRLFSALIANSLDHARSTVVVDVALSTSGKDALIRVQDDGPGFPPEIVDRAFERFSSSRSPGTHPAEEAGHQRHYGIGLALVSEIATRFGGAVWIESAGTEAGATVAVRFPVHTEQ